MTKLDHMLARASEDEIDALLVVVRRAIRARRR